MYYAVLGDKDQAFMWLRKGFETRSVAMVRTRCPRGTQPQLC